MGTQYLDAFGMIMERLLLHFRMMNVNTDMDLAPLRLGLTISFISFISFCLNYPNNYAVLIMNGSHILMY